MIRSFLPALQDDKVTPRHQSMSEVGLRASQNIDFCFAPVCSAQLSWSGSAGPGGV